MASLTQSKSCWVLRSIEEEREWRRAFINSPDKSVEREFAKAILSIENNNLKNFIVNPVTYRFRPKK